MLMVRFLLILALLGRGGGRGRIRVRLQQDSVGRCPGRRALRRNRRAADTPGLADPGTGECGGNLRGARRRSWTGSRDAQAALTSATGSNSIAQRSAAEKQFDSAVGQVMALSQTYPQLNSSNNFLNLQQNLADTEDKAGVARQYYNDAVATLNRLVTHDPVDVRRRYGRRQGTRSTTRRRGDARRTLAVGPASPPIDWADAFGVRRHSQTSAAVAAPPDRLAAPRRRRGADPTRRRIGSARARPRRRSPRCRQPASRC